MLDSRMEDAGQEFLMLDSRREDAGQSVWGLDLGVRDAPWLCSKPIVTSAACRGKRHQSRPPRAPPHPSGLTLVQYCHLWRLCFQACLSLETSAYFILFSASGLDMMSWSAEHSVKTEKSTRRELGHHLWQRLHFPGEETKVQIRCNLRISWWLPVWYSFNFTTLILASGVSWYLSRKNLSEMQETRVRSLSWEHPLKEEMVTDSNILARTIPRTEEPGWL